ncbi:MAG: SCP2 sterol-binding domain-containing protein [Actinobacteria bacterium]|nr:SCP2 sterol-binding domain-containing protein [Actinomycetota bacterium]
MPRYATPEWIAGFNRALAATDAGPHEGAPLVVQYLLEDAPADCTSYALRVTPDGARVVPGIAEDATVTFRQSYGTAVAIAQGERSAQRSVLDGSVVIIGDATQLLGRAALLGAIDRALDTLS